MARQFILIAASSLVLLFAQTDLLAQQKAPVNSDPIASLAEDMDEIVMAPTEALPDTPASPIVFEAPADKAAPVQMMAGTTLKEAAMVEAKLTPAMQEAPLDFFPLDMPQK